VIELFQAEWCPFSAAVRERLTELGLDFVARQVEPWEEQRTNVRVIPTLVTEDGDRIEGTDAVFAYLARLEAWAYEREHRGRWHEHAAARRADATGGILERDAPI
jgi:glutathione S-transferase